MVITASDNLSWCNMMSTPCHNVHCNDTLLLHMQAVADTSKGGQWHLWFCVRVHAVKAKQLELSTPNLIDIQCKAVTQHALPWGPKVKVTWLSNELLAWVCMLIGLLNVYLVYPVFVFTIITGWVRRPKRVQLVVVITGQMPFPLVSEWCPSTNGHEFEKFTHLPHPFFTHQWIPQNRYCTLYMALRYQCNV